jgi:prevent-host-death family protein
MNTASVRDLRNRFADVAKWIEHGEAVTITRNGTAFATLAPVKPAKPPKADWATRLAKRPPLGRRISEAETNALWSRLRD